ncbi:MAG: polysaccharide biosynthesis tyrosine autokinase [Bacteroidales bacterium]|nr:polysaccharide biosynthesis tyrosine autokinase [Bacteroidales bacterium]
MENNEKYTPRRKEEMDPIDRFKDFLWLCLDNWYWFVLSFVIVFGIAFVRILKTPPLYTRTATVLIKETNMTRSRSDLESMLNMGGVSQMNSKLSNEIVAFRSPDLMLEVVRQLGLNYSYFQDTRFHKTMLYGTALPGYIKFTDEENVPSMKAYIARSGDGSLEIYNMEYTLDGESVKDKNRYSAAPGSPLTTPAGELVINVNPYFEGEWDFPVYVTTSPLATATTRCTGRLGTSAIDQKNFSDLLQLTYTDQSKERADDVLNCVIAVYNANWVDDRNKMAMSTSMFISERLTSIEKDLSGVDSDISSYKSRNLLPDVAAASSMYMSQSTELNRQIQEVETQISTSRYVRNYLNSKVDGSQLIPLPAGLSDAAITGQINTYNNLLIQRNSLVASSSASNPLVVEMDANLEAMRLAICESVDNQIVVLQDRLQSLRRTADKATSRLADNPNQAMYLLSVERRQKVMESLYLYLLQKREENELSQAFTAYNTRVITSPTAANVPPVPNKKRMLLLAFIIALGIPVAVLYLLETLNTTIRGRKDLDLPDIPFLGEIPMASEKQSRLDKLLKRNADKEDYTLYVKPGKRDSVNEAFRVIRTNLEFMDHGNGGTVVAMTSFNPGSGKTFISLNLGATLAIKKMKVLLVDGDFRRASLSSLVGSPVSGFANYLSGQETSLNQVIRPYPDVQGLDVLPVGAVPPNPSELIGDAAFRKAVDELRKVYDYILIDCPPVHLVADTQLITRLADRTIFLLRVGLLEKSMLPELETMHENGQFNGLSVILNGTELQSRRRYYAYGYGYGYGSHSYYGNKK